jgi:hypothetical protein
MKPLAALAGFAAGIAFATYAVTQTIRNGTMTRLLLAQHQRTQAAEAERVAARAAEVIP